MSSAALSRPTDVSRVVVGMAVSLDGSVQDAGGSADALYPDLEALRGTPYTDA